MSSFALRLTAFAMLAAALVACGGDGERSAEDRLPELDDEGLELVEEGTDQFAGADNRLALYIAEDGRGVQVRVYVYEDETIAANEYAAQSVALENPPPEFLGAEVDQDEIDALTLGDESRAFVTGAPDDAGNRVWTDIARSGPVLTITQILAPEDDSDYVELRTSIVGSTFD